MKRGPALEERITAKNGIEIFSYKNQNLHGFFISLFVRAGSMYEADTDSGITHFLEHALIRNVNKIMNGDLYKTLDSKGIEFNASTYAEMVQFYISGAKKNFKLSAEIIAKLLSPVILAKSDVDAERKRIKAEIRESDDKNSLTNFTNSISYSGTSLSSSILGTNKSVDKITGTRLENYRYRVFSKENVFIYVSGNFESDDIEFLAEELSKYEISSGSVHENFAPVPIDFAKRNGGVYVKNADFTMVRFTFDLDMVKLGMPETDIIYDILFSGYASRFFSEMSEARGMFYDINGALDRYRNIGQLYFSFEVREAELYESVKLSVDILKRLKSQALDDSDLMKAAYVDNAYMLFDDAREFNFTFAYDAHIMARNYRTLEDRVRAYKSVTSESIRSAACEIFRPDNLIVSLKGNKKRIETERIKEIISEL